MTKSMTLPAPAFDAGAVGLPWHRRAWRQGVAYLLPNITFLALPAFLSRDGLPTGRWLLLLLLLAAIGVVFVGVSIVAGWSPGARRRWIALLAGLILAMAMVGSDAVLVSYFAPFICGATALLIPWRSARTVILAAAALGVVIALVERDGFAAVLALAAAMIGMSVGQGLEGARLQNQLRQAEERTAVLAVAAERERIARDLHDILGHSLTTIAVKADLASRLAARDAEASRTEIDEVATIARQALADVRATASGMREVRLASELASAKSVLLAAGIEAHAPSALPVMDDRDSELLGYVVREAITNVLRHSGAANVHIRVTEDFLEVADDGLGMTGEQARSGLRGLEQRLQQAGWALVVAGDGGTSVRAFRQGR